MNKNKLSIWLPVVVAVSMIIGMALGFTLRQQTRPAGSFIENDAPSSMSEIVRIVERNYVDTINMNVLKNDAVNAFLKQLDPYSTYLPPLEAQVFNEEMQGTFKGIGIDYEKINDTLHILSLTENSPAERAGMKVGDHLIKLNDKDITYTHQPNLDFRVRLREEIKKNNELNFIISRNNNILQIAVSAAIVPLPSVNVAYLYNSTIGIIKLSKFSETSYMEFMSATDSLLKTGMKNLIIDLRGNLGGIMEQAFQIAGEFFSANTLIFSTVDKNGKKEFRTLRDGIYKDLKIIVLVDESTASSSEIFAGAIQDYDRGLIVGRKTVGKALVQNMFRLSDGGAIRISVARYFTPLGRNIQILNNNHINDSLTRNIFITKDGKKLYSHDAIMPDILVPIDSSAYPVEVREFYVKGLLSQFVYKYFIAHQQDFTKYKSPKDFSTNFTTNDYIWNGIQKFASLHGYVFDNLNVAAKQEMLYTFEDFLGRQLWRNPGYFIVSNYHDNIVKTAVQNF